MSGAADPVLHGPEAWERAHTSGEARLAVLMAVVGFTDWSTNAAPATQYFRYVVDELILPYAASRDIGDLTEATTLSTGLLDGRKRRWPAQDVPWDRLSASMHHNDFVTVSCESPTGGGVSRTIANLTASWGPIASSDATGYVQLRLNVAADDRFLSASTQDRLVQAAIGGVVGLGGSWADVTLDHGDPLLSAHQEHVGQTFREALLNARDQARGYAWLSVLAPRLAHRVGGAARLRAALPDATVESIGSPAAEETVVIRLTPDMRAVSDEDLRQLKAALEPILPRRGATDYQYSGPPLRIVEP